MSSNSSQTDSRLSSQKYFPDGDSSRIHSAPFAWPTHLVGEKGTKIWISPKQIQLKERRAPNTWYWQLFSKLRIRALWDTSLVILCYLWTKGINHIDALYACSNQFQTGQSFHRPKYGSGVEPDLIINTCVYAILSYQRYPTLSYNPGLHWWLQVFLILQKQHLFMTINHICVELLVAQRVDLVSWILSVCNSQIREPLRKGSDNLLSTPQISIHSTMCYWSDTSFYSCSKYTMH